MKFQVVVYFFVTFGATFTVIHNFIYPFVGPLKGVRYPFERQLEEMFENLRSNVSTTTVHVGVDEIIKAFDKVPGKLHRGYTACFKDSLANNFKNINVTWINEEEIEREMKQICIYSRLTKCPTPAYKGPLKVNTEKVSLEYIRENELRFVREGGWWMPLHCNARQRTAIILPYRNRSEHLPVLLRHLHPILRRQMLHYRIFVIEQDDRSGFNRGKLLNIGYAEAKKIFPYSCYVQHDVDLVPEDDRVDYACVKSPKHLCPAVSTFNYQLFKDDLFGGVTSFLDDHYRKVNGYSNIFYVWGAEDDILYERVQNNNLTRYRESMKVGRYKMLKHVDRRRTRPKQELDEMNANMKEARKYPKQDGLNSLMYRVNEMHTFPLYTLIKVDLLKEKEKTVSKHK